MCWQHVVNVVETRQRVENFEPVRVFAKMVLATGGKLAVGKRFWVRIFRGVGTIGRNPGFPTFWAARSSLGSGSPLHYLECRVHPRNRQGFVSRMEGAVRFYRICNGFGWVGELDVMQRRMPAIVLGWARFVGASMGRRCPQ